MGTGVSPDVYKRQFQIIQQEQFSLSSLEMALSSVLSSAVEYAIHHNLELFTEDQPCYTAAEVIYSGYSLEEIEEKMCIRDRCSKVPL